jgi:phosphate:Na+ symporter
MKQFDIILQVFAGLALFLFGIRMLSNGLKKIAGSKLKKLLERMTSNKYKGILVGAVTTTLIQSSSLTMVTQIGLMNAGLLTLEQSVGIIMGQEIGTTVTAQIVAFPIGNFFLLMIIAGFILYIFPKFRNYRQIGQILLGFGILFLGMKTMSDGAKGIMDYPVIIDTLVRFGSVPILGIITGAIFTGVIQSSSATTGLVIAMGMSNVISLPAAIALILGANIGTCVTGFIASLGSCRSAKRAAFIQIFMNVVTVAIFIPFIQPYSSLIGMTSANLPRQIANAHTIYNIISILLILPFTRFLVILTKKIIPGEITKTEERVSKYLDERFLRTPFMALSQASREINRISKIALNMLDLSNKALIKNDEKAAKEVFKNEDLIDDLCYFVENYVDRIPTNELNEKEYQIHIKLLHAITDIERTADLSNNIAVSAMDKINKEEKFTEIAKKEMDLMFKKARSAYNDAIKSLKKDDKELAKKVVEMEDQIDAFEKKFKKNHIRRLKEGTCDVRTDVIFTDTLRNLERIGDHADNIACSVLTNFTNP